MLQKLKSELFKLDLLVSVIPQNSNIVENIRKIDCTTQAYITFAHTKILHLPLPPIDSVAKIDFHILSLSCFSITLII